MENFEICTGGKRDLYVSAWKSIDHGTNLINAIGGYCLSVNMHGYKSKGPSIFKNNADKCLKALMVSALLAGEY